MKKLKNFAAWIGLDWADKRHWVCLSEGDSESPEEFSLEQDPRAIHEWVGKLRQRFGGRSVAVAVEKSRGTLIYTLMEYDFIVLYPIHPQAVSNYRKSLRVSGVKNDQCDGWMLWSFLRKHWQELRAWQPEDPETRELRLLAENRRGLVAERTRVSNRLKSYLKDYYPQILQWFGSVSSERTMEFIRRWPSLQQAQRAHAKTLLSFLTKKRMSEEKARTLIRQIRQEKALTNDPAILGAYPLMVKAAVAQLEVLQGAVEEFDEKIEKLFQEHSEAEIFASFPGAGATLAPRLAVAFGTDHERWDAYSMQCFSGIAPVEESSGDEKPPWVHHRFVCPTFVKQTFHEFAKASIPHSIWAKAYYRQQREKGAGHHQAIRALAFKWIRILTCCWKNATRYSEEAYLAALRRTHSPLVERIEQIDGTVSA